MSPPCWESGHGLERTTLHLATMFEGLSCYFHLTRNKFEGFGGKTMYRVGIQGHKAKSNYFKEIVCTHIVSTIVTPSFKASPKSQNRLAVHTWAIIKCVLISESSQVHFSWLMLSSNYPALPCKEKLQPLHRHLTHTLTACEPFPSYSLSTPNIILSFTCV
jgi:hypothetical protein